MSITINTEPIISLNLGKLAQAGISEQEVHRYLLPVATQAFPVECATWKFFLLRGLGRPVSFIQRLLKPRGKEEVGGLSQDEVLSVYSKLAKRYDALHHINTGFMDETWRREMANCVLVLAQAAGRPIQTLDLCTGTGLTARATLKTLQQNGFTAEATCLDYTPEMISVARHNLREFGDAVKIVRGDATNLTANDGVEFANFPPGSFDAITQMCGTGGVPDSVAAFHEVLKVLAPGGKFFMSDVHRPNSLFPKGFPILFWEVFSPELEMLIWNETSLPLIFRQMWAWHDPSADFHLAPLVTWQDQSGQWWGFEREEFRHTTATWFLGFPIISTAFTTLKKVKISPEEAQTRIAILKACSFKR